MVYMLVCFVWRKCRKLGDTSRTTAHSDSGNMSTTTLHNALYAHAAAHNNSISHIQPAAPNIFMFGPG